MRAHPVEISAAARIAAPAARVYGIISDYREGHPRILPPRHLSGLQVESGGYGAGTVIRYTLTLLGRRQQFRAAVEEPEPGRVLVERSLDRQGARTTFRVESVSQDSAHVTITTAWEAATLGDRIAAALARRLLPAVYREELRLLEHAAAQPPAG